MDLQARYDELDNLISSINSVIDDLTDKNYIEQLELIKYEAQNEFDEVSEKLQEQRDREEKEQENEYWRTVI